MLQFLTRRKLNQIDLAIGIAAGIFFSHEEYLAWAAILLVGSAISVACEQWAKNQAYRHD